MEIKFIAPKGEPINDYSSLEIIDEITNEFSLFTNESKSKPKIKKRTKKAPENAGGLPEIATWIWENFQDLWQDEDFRSLFYLLLKSLAFKVASLFGRKESRESKHRIEITHKDKTLYLPNTQTKIDEFFNDLNS